MADLDAAPRRGVLVLTCMDARVEPLAVLGLRLGDAHVLRNAGGRVTDDVLRGVRLSTDTFGVSTIVVMEHTRCAAGIDDHLRALCDDIDVLVDEDMASVDTILGVLYDVDERSVTELVRQERPIAS